MDKFRQVVPTFPNILYILLREPLETQIMILVRRVKQISLNELLN